MKRYLNYLYTDISKALIVCVALTLVWLTGNSALKTVNFYKQDPAATLNVLMQQENFDYDTSVFKSYAIKEAVENILTYSLEYGGDNGTSETHDSIYYSAKHTVESYRNFHFALVNHTSETIVSDIPELNAKASDTNVRDYFDENPESLLIVRNSRSPYYEAGTMTDYVDMVESMSKGYADNFDIYISFPEDFLFAGSEEEYRSRHETFLSELGAYLNRAVILYVIAVILLTVEVIISGRKRVGGRIYASSLDRIPNDLTAALYIIVLMSMGALLENSLYMIIQTTNHEDFWFNTTPEFYALRAKICLTVATGTVTCFACTLKRQIGMKTLFKNTYVYRVVLMHNS